MEFNALPINERTHQNIEKVEKVINGVVRGYDRFKGIFTLWGRKALYLIKRVDFIFIESVSKRQNPLEG